MRWQHTLVVALLDRPDSFQHLAPRRREREAAAQFPLFTAEVLGALRT